MLISTLKSIFLRYRVLRVAMDGRRSDTFYLKNNVSIIHYTARTSLALRCKLSKS